MHRADRMSCTVPTASARPWMITRGGDAGRSGDTRRLPSIRQRGPKRVALLPLPLLVIVVTKR